MMARGELIRGVVAEVVNDREIIINKGSNAGVELGMRFAVIHFNEKAPVVDPETGESLGSLSLAKALVKIVRVTPKLAVGRTYRKFTFSGVMPNILQGRSEIERISYDDMSYAQRAELDNVVRVGDRVRQTVGDEFED